MVIVMVIVVSMALQMMITEKVHGLVLAGGSAGGGGVQGEVTITLSRYIITTCHKYEPISSSNKH